MSPLIGNKSSEKDVREWLNANGFVGRSAKFIEMELHAIKRPGWLQVFRFEINVLTVDDEKVHLHGAFRGDERYGDPKISVYQDLAERDAQLAEWSEGLITGRRQRRS